MKTPTGKRRKRGKEAQSTTFSLTSNNPYSILEVSKNGGNEKGVVESCRKKRCEKKSQVKAETVKEG